METHTERTPVNTELQPLAGWEALSRWNEATFAWMARGFQQWVAIMTTVPPHFLAPPQAGVRSSFALRPAAEAPRERAGDDQPALAVHAAAKSEPRRATAKNKSVARKARKDRG